MATESVGTDYFRGRPGEFWITLADQGGPVPVRLLAPDVVADDSPLTLVIALHGAGGSENMFFDAYGAGKIVELCRQRGWILVAPRLSFFGLGMSADHLIAEIGRLYPIDGRQFFVVGHSMGAARRLSQALHEAGAAGVRWSEYPDTEHLGVMQAALPEVFAFFDEIAAGVGCG